MINTTRKHPNFIRPFTGGIPVPRMAVSVLALMLIASVGSAVAQTTSDTTDQKKQNTQNSDQPIQLEAFVVHGYQQSLAASLNAKRSANAIVDVITAQDVSKFPDTNVAESLSHIPGVTVDRQFGQGERVSILGTDPNLNRTLLNGQDVASGDWYILDAPSRQFNYTLLAPEVIGKAEVYKTPEARLPEGSIGGTVILNTRDPMKLRPMVFSGSVSDMYNDRGKKNDGNISGVFSWHDSRKMIGILIGLQQSKEYIRRDGIEALGTTTAGAIYANQQAYNSSATVPADSPGITDPSAYLPNAINAALFEQTRKRTGGNVVIDFRPTDNLKMVFNGLKVKLNDNNFNSSFYTFPGWWKGGVIQSGTVVNGILDKASISDNIGVMDLFNRQATIKTESYDLKTTYTADKYKLSSQFGYTKATGGTQHQYYIEPLLSYASGTNTDVGTTSYTYTGGASNPGFSFTDSTVANNPKAWTVGGPWWNGNVAADPETDRESYGQVDAEIPVKTDFVRKVLAGIRYSDHKTGQNWYNISLTTLPFYTLANFNPTSTPGNFLSGLPNITPDEANHVIIDPNALGKAVENADSGINGLTMQQAVNAGKGFQPTQSFQVIEKIKAGYVQANFARNKISGNIGVRFVQTNTESDGYIASGSTVTPTSVKKTYSNVLPALNVVYELNNNQLLRFGVSKVMARPNYADESSSVTLYDSIQQGVGGNPHLDPYESTDLDGSFEWYFAKNSAFSASLFYKDISNYILNSNGTENYYNQNRGMVTPYTISRPQNAGKATSKGFAVSYQQQFGNGFGATANYTYVDASGKDGAALPFASKNQVNISPYFENDKFLVRLTYGWRSAYFFKVDRGNNVYTKAYTELDANVAYNITKNVSLTLACTNLLDETYYQYAEVPARMFQDEYKTGRRYQAGLHWNF